MMSRRLASMVTLTGSLVLVLAVAGSGAATAERSEAAARAHGILTAISTFDCIYDCTYVPCAQDYHWLRSGGGDDDNGAGTHSCDNIFGMECDQLHECQEINDDELASLGELLRDLPGAEIARLADDTGILSVNNERRAVQVQGCGANILLSLNLSESQQAGLGLSFPY